MKKHLIHKYITVSNPILLTLLFFFNLSLVKSQVYPVQVNSFFIPPYSTQLSDYAVSTENKFTLQLLLKDINVSNRQVRLKLYIEGNGLKIQSNDFVIGAPNIYLTGGIMEQYTSVDLRAYFQLNNLSGISPSEYSKPLPDGIYTISWEVYDFLTNQKISLKSGTPVYLLQNDPPFLNLPVRGENIEERNPVNIIFQWTPRHVNATNVNYLFQIREIWDSQMDPQAAFLASPDYYTEETYSNILHYNMSKPVLLPGKTYAWRVKAMSRTGLTENNIFKNNGYSEIFYFKYSTTCGAPTFPLTEAVSPQTVKVKWQGLNTHNKYHIQYRKKEKNTSWFEVYTQNQQVQIGNLESGATYEFRVGGTCDPLSNLTQSYTYTGINEFTMPKKNEQSTYNCGINPDIKITNTNPLLNLAINESFTAGDFTVTVKQIQGYNGVYSGKGYIVVPYLADTRIAVEFTGIRINTDNQLYYGKVETTYDMNWGGMVDVGNYTGEGNDEHLDITVNFPIKEIVKGPNGQIIIVGEGGQTVEYPVGKDYTFTDSNGTVWSVDAEGKTNGSQQAAEGGKSTPDNTEGVDSDGNAIAITAEGIKVIFEGSSNGRYGFDAANSNNKQYPDYILTANYTLLGTDYYVPYKAVKNGDTDVITAKIHITDTAISSDSLIFKTKEGAEIKADKLSSTEFKLTVQGTFSYATQEIHAVIKQEEKYKIAGVFKLVHISEKEPAKVVLVKLGEAVKTPVSTQVENYLNTIYTKAGAKFQIQGSITITDPLSGNTKIETEKSGFTAQYTADQQKINSAIKARPDYDNKAYYLIFTNKTPSSGESGFMPLSRQFGYIFNGSTHTIAHELGHGVFGLRHPYDEKGEYPEGKTDWLMDYSGGEKLPKRDWEEIQNPKFRIGIFDDKSDGDYNENVHFALTPNGFAFDDFYLDGTKIEVISLLTQNSYTVNGIIYKEERYGWEDKEQAYINGTKKITVKKSDNKKNLNRVNLLRSISNCYYEYLVVEWLLSDEQSKEVSKIIQDKIEASSKNWISSPLSIRDGACEQDFLSELEKLNNCSGEDISKDEEKLKVYWDVDNVSTLVDVINSVCLESLRNLSYDNILSAFDRIQKQESIKEKSEVAVLRLMNALNSKDYKTFFAYLGNNNNQILKHLVEEMDDQSAYFWDGNNYTNFIGALIKMYSIAPDIYADKLGEIGSDKLLSQIFNLDPQPFEGIKGIEVEGDNMPVLLKMNSFKFGGKLDESTGKIIVSQYQLILPVTTSAPAIPSYAKVADMASLDLLDPVIITVRNQLPLVETALDKVPDGKEEIYIVPAIFLHYQSDKEFNDMAEKYVMITLDAATIITSGGTALAAKVSWAKRSWALMEVAGAMGNIAMNIGVVDPNSNLGKATEYYNVAMAVIGIKNVGKGVVHFTKNLPENTRTLLKNNGNIKELITAKYLDWKVAVYGIDEFTVEEVRMLGKQEDTWRLLNIDNVSVNSIADFWARIPANYLDNVKQAFDGVPATVKYAEKDMIIYRHISQNQKEISFWFSRSMESPENARKLLALPKDNTAEWIVKLKVKEGTPYIEGKVASQVNNPKFGKDAIGGGNQLYFLNENLSDIEIIEKIINPFK